MAKDALIPVQFLPPDPGSQEGDLDRWLVREGDIVHRFADIARILVGERAVLVPAGHDGQIRRLAVAPGSRVLSGQTLAWIDPGADLPPDVHHARDLLLDPEMRALPDPEPTRGAWEDTDLPLLWERLSSPIRKIRLEAASRLADRAEEPAAEAILVDLCADPDPRLRREAARGLCLRAASHLAVLTMLLGDEDPDVRKLAVAALGIAEDPWPAPALEATAGYDPDPDARRWAGRG